MHDNSALPEVSSLPSLRNTSFLFFSPCLCSKKAKKKKRGKDKKKVLLSHYDVYQNSGDSVGSLSLSLSLRRSKRKNRCTFPFAQESRLIRREHVSFSLDCPEPLPILFLRALKIVRWWTSKRKVSASEVTFVKRHANFRSNDSRCFLVIDDGVKRYGKVLRELSPGKLGRRKMICNVRSRSAKFLLL